MVRTKTRDEILSVAARQFARAGFKGTSLQHIADEVGCSKATLLYHFDGKHAILTALVEPASRALVNLVDELVPLDADRARDAAIDGFVDLVLHYRREVALIFDELNLLEHPAFESLRPSVEALVRACAGRSTDPDDRLTAEVTLAGISAVALNKPDVDPAHLRDPLVRVARRALVPLLTGS
jgi:AcrR family transcriptional regulator